MSSWCHESHPLDRKGSPWSLTHPALDGHGGHVLEHHVLHLTAEKGQKLCGPLPGARDSVEVRKVDQVGSRRDRCGQGTSRRRWASVGREGACWAHGPEVGGPRAGAGGARGVGGAGAGREGDQGGKCGRGGPHL